MDYEFIKSRLAPCGSHRGKCFAFKGGDILRTSKQLKSLLGNFDVYTERFVDLLGNPVFSKYHHLKKFLNIFLKVNVPVAEMKNANYLRIAKSESV